jgi:serine phosphatase RsbU (regulator of sigma subunit)
LTLEPGASLLLFSDGLVERRGEDLDVGLRRLTDSLRAAPDDLHAIPDVLLDANLRDDHRRDDVCLLLVARGRVVSPRAVT